MDPSWYHSAIPSGGNDSQRADQLPRPHGGRSGAFTGRCGSRNQAKVITGETLVRCNMPWVRFSHSFQGRRLRQSLGSPPTPRDVRCPPTSRSVTRRRGCGGPARLLILGDSAPMPSALAGASRGPDPLQPAMQVRLNKVEREYGAAVPGMAAFFGGARIRRYGVAQRACGAAASYSFRRRRHTRRAGRSEGALVSEEVVGHEGRRRLRLVARQPISRT